MALDSQIKEQVCDQRLVGNTCPRLQQSATYHPGRGNTRSDLTPSTKSKHPETVSAFHLTVADEVFEKRSTREQKLV